MRGFQYKDKEGVEMFLGKSYVNESFTLSGVTLTRGFTVCLMLKHNIFNMTKITKHNVYNYMEMHALLKHKNVDHEHK